MKIRIYNQRPQSIATPNKGKKTATANKSNVRDFLLKNEVKASGINDNRNNGIINYERQPIISMTIRVDEWVSSFNQLIEPLQIFGSSESSNKELHIKVAESAEPLCKTERTITQMLIRKNIKLKVIAALTLSWFVWTELCNK